MRLGGRKRPEYFRLDRSGNRSRATLVDLRLELGDNIYRAGERW